MADVVVAGSDWAPDQWFEFLMNKFDADLPETPRVITANTPKTRRERLNLLWSYFIGDPPLPQVQDKYKETFREVLRKARNNYSAMSVKVMTAKSVLIGVSTDADSDIDGDDLARQIAAASGWKAMQRDLQTFMYVFGEAYALIIPALEGVQDAVPMITAENPRFAVGQPDPVNPRRLRAFVKVYNDEIADQQVGLLFVDSNRFEWRREVGQYTTNFKLDEWTLAGTEPLQGLELFGGVPAVRFDNEFGLGEFEPNIDLLDRVMDGVLQRIVIQWYQSFRQRAVKGDLEAGADLTDPDEDLSNFIRRVADDNLQDLFTADPGALWLVPEGVDFWESGQADLTQQLAAIRDDVKEFAASTGTPLHVITPDAANQSAEGASLMRETLVDKIVDRQERMTAPWVLTWQIAFAMASQVTRLKGVNLLWAKVDKESLAAKGEAISKTRGVLSRKRQLINIMEMTPEEAKLNESELLQEQLAAQAFAAPVATASATQGSQQVSQSTGSTGTAQADHGQAQPVAQAA
ncbi:phage portal protein [Nocardia vinacea]|uniref:phage portal protein n=1 Tax=Nocardia vinacea TaxID=96468 RepID=UPI0033F1C318